MQQQDRKIATEEGFKQQKSSDESNLLARRLKECLDEDISAEMPNCLENALGIIFGKVGGKAVKDLAEKDLTWSLLHVRTPGEVWARYDHYIEAWRHRLGNDATKLIEFQVKKQIESLGCTECPIYKRLLENSRK